MRKIMGLIVALMLIMIATPSLSQEAPPEVDIALQTLSTALNITITPDMLDNVSWRELTYTSTALGCPVPQQTYQAGNIVGYQIFLVYQGITYDYRVSTGAEFVILCGTSDAPFVAPVEQPAVVIDPVVVDPVDPVDTNNNECPNALLPRLAIGETARTTPLLGSNVRDLPDLNSTDIGTIAPSDTFIVIDGPACGVDGNYWYQVDYDGLVGWVVQGLDGLYFIEPIPQPLIGVTSTISFSNASQVVPISEIEGNLLGISAWSPDGQMVAIADASTANPAIWIYFVGDLSQVPVSIEVDFDTTALAFSPDGTLLAVGSPNGNVYLLETNTYSVVHSFVAHDTAVLDIDFSPTGEYMIVVDDNYTARFYGVVTQ